MLGLRPGAAAALAAAALCAVLAVADPAAAPRHGEPGEVGERQRVANLPPFLMQFKNAVHKSNRSGADRATRSAFHRWCGIAVNKEQGNEYDSDDLAAAAGIVGAEKLWHYNWKMSSEVRVNNVELVPMIKEPGHTLGVDVNDLPAAFQDGRGGVVKGWNEPDEGSQAGRDYNLRSNPEAFAQAWTSDMLAARAKGYTEFIGPAMAQDTCWLDYFLKACETTAGCKELVTYLAFHRYRLDCASYEAHPDNPGWRDDLSYLLTYYRIMQKYNARGFNIKGLVFDELGCLTPSWTFSGEEEQLRYMQQWYQLTLVKVKTGDAETISTIKHTNWIMPKGPDAHGGESYSLGMCTAQDGGANAAEDAVRAIQSLVTVAWFSISPGQNHLFTRGGGLSTLGQVYFDACKNVEETGGVPPGEVISEPTPTPVTPSPTPDGGDGDSSDSGDDPLDGAIAKIVAQVTGKVLFAASGENLEEGFGAGNPEEHAEDSDWRLVRVAAGRYRIVSRYADRALYASSSSNWGEGMGASNPSSEVGGDGEWNFVAQDGATLYRIVNALNNRCLYAAREGHFGAGSPASWVGDDGVWSVQVQRSSATPAPATPAPATPAPATPAPATPGPATPAPTTPVPATSAPTPAPTPTPTPAPTPMPTPAPTPTPTPAPQGGRDDELDGRRVRITNAAVQRALYAQAWLNWEWGFGVGATGAELGDAGVWRLELVIGNRYRIINEASNRALYAPSSSNWEKGLGAGSPPEKVGGDGEWKIIPQSGHHRYRLVNNENDRCLYATSSNWGQGLGAGSPETKVGVDGVWEFTFLN